MSGRTTALFVLVFLALVFRADLALADKAAASIEAPQIAQKGVEVAIRVTVTHSANTSSHHTEWLNVTVNGKEVARWEYTDRNLPEGATFTKDVKVKVDQDMQVTAQASCNRHGSRGPATVKIAVK
jgi:desulfoferrodoxin (superoxide reductase-like protein)